MRNIATTNDEDGLESRMKRRSVVQLVRRGGVASVTILVLIVALASGIAIEATHVFSASPQSKPVNNLHGTDLAADFANDTSSPTSPSGGGATTASTLPAGSETQAPAVPIPGGALPGVGNFNAVTCVDALDCLAVGGASDGSAVTATTSDDGGSWTGQPVPSGSTTLDAVSCGTSTTCVAVGQGVILNSSTGGTSWTMQAPPVANATLLSVSCASATQCVATGATASVGGALGGAITVSSDGGSTWTTAQVPQGTQALGGVACPTTTFCVAVGGSIEVSNDGGMTWTTVTLSGGLTSALRSVTCTSATQCVAVGANVLGQNDPTLPGEMVATSDGGVTWQPVSLPASTAFVDQIVCGGGTQCFVSGSDDQMNGPAAFAQSTDGGATWQSVPPPSGLTQIADIACPSTNDCVAVGRNGTQPVTSQSSGGSPWLDTALPQ